MADGTGIEWTDATWNPVVGCAKVSAGCKNCYAMVDSLRVVRQLRAIVAKRDDGGTERQRATLQAYEGVLACNEDGELLPRWRGNVRLMPERLDQPIRWQKPRRIFVNSMSDLFHDDVPFEFIAAVFGAMAAAPQHTFQVLTKRPARMLEFFEWVQSPDRHPETVGSSPSLECAWQLLRSEARHHPEGVDGPVHKRGPETDAEWPLANVDIGVSVEDQKSADERIPLLLQCPAAVRWLSMEPLLGAVDVAPFVGFRHEDEWDADGVVLRNPDQRLPEAQRLPFHDPWVRGIDWVVVGGESGAAARPMHPEWVRSLRDQCVAAGVPFHFKQWGEWAVESLHDLDPDGVPGTMACYEIVGSTDCDVAGELRWRAHSGDRTESLACVGKKKAGRLLDGRTWDGVPKLREAD